MKEKNKIILLWTLLSSFLPSLSLMLEDRGDKKVLVSWKNYVLMYVLSITILYTVAYILLNTFGKIEVWTWSTDLSELLKSMRAICGGSGGGGGKSDTSVCLDCSTLRFTASQSMSTHVLLMYPSVQRQTDATG